MTVRLGQVIFWCMTGLAVLSLVGGATIVAGEWPRNGARNAHEWWLVLDHAGLTIVLATCLFLFG